MFKAFSYIINALLHSDLPHARNHSFCKLILKRFNEDLTPVEWIPEHPFGFRQAHSMLQQCHRLTNTINKTLKIQEFCAAAFLDIR